METLRTGTITIEYNGTTIERIKTVQFVTVTIVNPQGKTINKHDAKIFIPGTHEQNGQVFEHRYKFALVSFAKRIKSQFSTTLEGEIYNLQFSGL